MSSFSLELRLLLLRQEPEPPWKGIEDIEVIDHKDESSVASARVLRKGGVLDFTIDDTPYVLQLVDYDATHIVSDNATFTVRLDR